MPVIIIHGVYLVKHLTSSQLSRALNHSYGDCWIDTTTRPSLLHQIQLIVSARMYALTKGTLLAAWSLNIHPTIFHSSRKTFEERSSMALDLARYLEYYWS